MPSNEKAVIRVLHVDDDLSLLEVSKQILLMENNFEIEIATSVDEAFKKMWRQNFDAIVSDYEMPQKDGLEFLKELREQGKEIPFILFTGKGREEVVVKALNLGADSYINKHGSPETVYFELADAINKTVERKKSENALRTSEANFKAYLESSPVSVFVTNQEGKYEYINEAAIKLLGFSRDELLNMTVHQVVPKEDMPRRRFNQLKEKGYFAEEMRLKQKNGTSIDVFLSASKLPDGKLVAFCEDISERKKAEEALKQLNEVLERVGECVGAGLAVIGKDYRVVWANQLLRALGVTSNKKCYQPFNKLESVCPDCGVKKIFEQNLPIDIHEFKRVNSKGETTWVELRVTPLKDKNGATMAALELAVPITERKKVEQELKENHDRIESMNEKLRVVGSLTRHDVGNKLMAAKSNLYLLKKRIGGNSELAKYFDGIETAFASAERIFEFSSLYEKIGSERPSKENIFECFNQAVALLPNLSNIKIVNECQGLEVIADSLLRQIFYNFIDNSLKHGEKVTQIKICCSKECDQVKLYYEDDGVGVPEANKVKLFEVGFTTGKGTGLGLYLVKKMMDVYGWQIQENGEPGKGIKIVMTIPEYSTNGLKNYFFSN